MKAEAKSIEDMIRMLQAASNELDVMRKDGVVLESGDSVGDDYALLVTTDPKVAEKYGMVDESDYWHEKEEDEERKDSSDKGRVEE